MRGNPEKGGPKGAFYWVVRARSREARVRVQQSMDTSNTQKRRGKNEVCLYSDVAT